MSTVEEYNARLAEMSDGEKRKVLRARLRLLGYACVAAEYSGSGDSGEVEDAECYTAQQAGDPSENGERMYTPGAKVPDAINVDVYDLLCKFLDDKAGGWENNDGGYGEIVWDLTTDTLHLHHNTHITSSEYDYITETAEDKEEETDGE